MKKTMFATLALAIALVSCSKSDDPTPVTPTPDKYMSITAFSTWNYAFTDNITAANSNSYTLTSSLSDSTSPSSGKVYHIFSSSNGNREYYNVTGNNYYSAQAVPDALGGAKIESLYLNSDAGVNATWSENVPMDIGLPTPINLVVTYKLKEKGISKTVGTTPYTGVMHIEVTIAAPAPFTAALTTNIQRYYAPKVGLIQDDTKIDLDYPAAGLNQHVDTQTKLVSAIIL